MADDIAPKTARIEAAEVKADSFSADKVNFDVQTTLDLAGVIDAVRHVSSKQVNSVDVGFKELARTIDRAAKEQLRSSAKLAKDAKAKAVERPTATKAVESLGAIAPSGEQNVSPAPNQVNSVTNTVTNHVDRSTTNNISRQGDVSVTKAAPTQTVKPSEKHSERAQEKVSAPKVQPKQRVRQSASRRGRELKVKPVTASINNSSTHRNVESVTGDVDTRNSSTVDASVTNKVTGSGGAKKVPASKVAKVKAVQDTNDKPSSVRGVNTPADPDYSKFKVDAGGRLRNSQGKYASKIEKQRYEADKAAQVQEESDGKQQTTLLGSLVKTLAKISVARSDQDTNSKLLSMNAMADSSAGNAVGVAMGGSYFLAAKQVLETAGDAKESISGYLKENEISNVGQAVEHGKLKAREAKEKFQSKASSGKERLGALKGGVLNLYKAFKGKSFKGGFAAAKAGFVKPSAGENAKSVEVSKSDAASESVASTDSARTATESVASTDSARTATESNTSVVKALTSTIAGLVSASDVSASDKSSSSTQESSTSALGQSSSKEAVLSEAVISAGDTATELNKTSASTSVAVERIEEAQSSVSAALNRSKEMSVKQLELDKGEGLKEQQRHAELLLKQDEVKDEIKELGKKLGSGGGGSLLDMDPRRRKKRRGRGRRSGRSRGLARGQMYGRGGMSTDGVSRKSGLSRAGRSTSRMGRMGRMGGTMGRVGGAVGGALGGMSGMLGGGAKMAGAVLSKAALPLAAAMAVYDGVTGFNDTEKQKETFNLKEGQEASFGQKMAMATGSIASLGGLTELVGLSSGDLAKGVYSLFGGNTKEQTKPESAALTAATAGAAAAAAAGAAAAIKTPTFKESVTEKHRALTGALPAKEQGAAAIAQPRVEAVALPSIPLPQTLSSELAQSVAPVKSQAVDTVSSVTDIESMINTNSAIEKTIEKQKAQAPSAKALQAPANNPRYKEMVDLLKSIDKQLKAGGAPSIEGAKSLAATARLDIPLDFSDVSHRRKANDIG